MNWLREAINDSQTNKASSKRVAIVSGAFSMSLAVVILAGAATLGHDVAGAITGVCMALAALGGAVYTQGKVTERTRNE